MTNNRFGNAFLYIFLGLVAGIILTLSLSFGASTISSESFCISCHEMADPVYLEYKESIHATNSSGVKVTCPDCHVPKELGPLLSRKFFAIKDIYHSIAGTISTAEKFDQRRQELANRVWDYMRENDSRECRSCHDFGAMNLLEQERIAQQKHQKATELGKTCIDCHKGVAHELPDDAFGENK